MSVVLVILIALGAGWYVGSRVQSAHDAHLRFTSYRARTNSSLSVWLKSAIFAAIGVGAVVFLFYWILTTVHIR